MFIHMANYVLQKVMEVDLNHFSYMVVSLQTKQGMGNGKYGYNCQITHRVSSLFWKLNPAVDVYDIIWNGFLNVCSWFNGNFIFANASRNALKYLLMHYTINIRGMIN